MSRVRGEGRTEAEESDEAKHARLGNHEDERRRDWEGRKIWGEVRIRYRGGKIAQVNFDETCA